MLLVELRVVSDAYYQAERALADLKKQLSQCATGSTDHDEVEAAFRRYC